MQAYYYITRIRILTNLVYRFDVITSIGTNIILMVAAIFLWNAAYGGISEVGGLNLQNLVTYTIVSILLGTLFVCNVQDTIYNKVREGSITTDFYRPIPLLGCYLADDIGGMVSGFIIKVVPLLLFASLFFGFPNPASLLSFTLFIFSCMLSFSILWILSALVGLIAFWVMEIGNMGMVKDSIVRVLSGSIVPLWFFPEQVQFVSRFLPFQYTYQTPLGIYIGYIDTTEALQAMAIQLLWIILLFLLLNYIWRKARTKTLIQGG